MTLSLSLFALLSLPSLGRGQATYYTWADLQNDWSDPLSWTATSGSGTTFPGSLDIAQFIGGANFNPINPVLTADTTITQLRFMGGPSNGWTFTGAFTLTAGTATTPGLVVSGGLNSTINIGTGSGPSLNLNGPTGNTGGSIIIGSGSLTLTGNTIANAGTITLRSGTLILDNSAGNPIGGQRLTSSGTVSLFGGGSTLEFRGASTGTIFSGFSNQALAASGGGDTLVRTIQQGNASLGISFMTLSRSFTSGSLLFENIGTGYVGDSGKPTITFIGPGSPPVTPTTRQGVLSSSPTTTLPWVAVTQRSSLTATSVTGRWANYSGGIVASTPTAYADDFSAAPAGSNIVFNPITSGTFTLTAPPASLASLVLEPAVPGVLLDIGTGLNTFGLMLSGTNDMTVNGTKLLGLVGSTRTVFVLSSTAALTTNASFNITNSSTGTTLGGNGFVILTGGPNQLVSSSYSSTGAASLSLAGGVLRGTTSNLVFTGGAGGARLQLRGGVLEYDVTGGSATFNMAVGTAINQVNWTGNAGNAAINNVGGGGFSAYVTAIGNTPGNTLTVNLGGASGTLYWNDSAATNPQLFITDGYALKFGSLRSNATVLWQNPIRLDGNSDGTLTNTIAANRVREVSVTRGVGNPADKTVMAGTISGSVTTDFLKTGTGVLVLTGNNDYLGNTFIGGGELQVSGQTGANSGTSTGMVVVRSGGTLAGNGRALGSVSVLSGGAIRGGDGTGVGQTLTTGALRLDTNTTLAAVVAGSSSIDYSTAGASLIASTSSFGRASAGGTIHIQLINDGTLPLDGTTQYTRQLVSYTGSAVNLPNGNYDASTSHFVVDGANFTVGSGWLITASTGALDVSFTALPLAVIPEPSHLVLMAGLALGFSRRIRRRIALG